MEEQKLIEEDQARRIRREKRERKKSKRRKVSIFLCIILIALFFGAFIGIRSSLPSKERPPVSEINGIPIITDLLSKDIPGRPGVKKKIKYIVIHETGNTGTNANAASHNKYIHKAAQEKQLSWHYTVDDHEIYQHLPDNEIGFHAGDGLKRDGGNMNGIGIEMCVNPENDYEQTLKNTEILVHYLLESYDLDRKDVKKHEDFSGKICPEKLIEEKKWDSFLDKV